MSFRYKGNSLRDAAKLNYALKIHFPSFDYDSINGAKINVESSASKGFSGFVDCPVLVTLEYHTDPNKAEEFTLAMHVLSKIRRRDGAIQWGLYQDVSNPSKCVETALVESWVEHRRQFDRVTNSDRVIEDRVMAFHIGEAPPKVSQMIYSKNDKRAASITIV